MVITLNALRRRKSLLLDACEIFVKEPLLDWVKQAKDKLIAFNLAQKSADI
jgi:phosphatidylinositol kinase/protein kinase (PI-3  family)